MQFHLNQQMILRWNDQPNVAFQISQVTFKCDNREQIHSLDVSIFLFFKLQDENCLCEIYR